MRQPRRFGGCDLAGQDDRARLGQVGRRVRRQDAEPASPDRSKIRHEFLLCEFGDQVIQCCRLEVYTGKKVSMPVVI